MRISRAIALLATTASLAAILTGCSAFGMLNDTNYQQRAYDNWGKASGALGGALAGFIPKDATELTMRWLNNGKGSILRYHSSKSPAASSCTAGTLTGKPRLDSQWWPEKEPKSGMLCEPGWKVFTSLGVTYAWSDTSIGS